MLLTLFLVSQIPKALEARVITFLQFPLHVKELDWVHGESIWLFGNILGLLIDNMLHDGKSVSNALHGFALGEISFQDVFHGSLIFGVFDIRAIPKLVVCHPKKLLDQWTDLFL